MAVFIDELARNQVNMALPTPSTGGKVVKQPIKSPTNQDLLNGGTKQDTSAKATTAATAKQKFF